MISSLDILVNIWLEMQDDMNEKYKTNKHSQDISCQGQTVVIPEQPNVKIIISTHANNKKFKMDVGLLADLEETELRSKT